MSQEESVTYAKYQSTERPVQVQHTTAQSYGAINLTQTISHLSRHLSVCAPQLRAGLTNWSLKSRSRPGRETGRNGEVKKRLGWANVMWNVCVYAWKKEKKRKTKDKKKAQRGEGKCMTLDIVQNKGQMSSQAHRRAPHIWTAPGVNILCDISAVCYFHRLNYSQLAF